MNYKQLTAADRGAIEALLSKKYTVSQIAEAIGRHPSTVSREIKQRIHDFLWSDQVGITLAQYSEQDIARMSSDLYLHFYRAYPKVPSPVSLDTQRRGCYCITRSICQKKIRMSN